MPINVEWQDESGETLDRLAGYLPADVVKRAPASTACLQFIDSYGDTTFNQHQLPVLIQELEALAAHVEGADLESVRSLVVFLRQAVDHLHTYVKFIGD